MARRREACSAFARLQHITPAHHAARKIGNGVREGVQAYQDIYTYRQR